mgnify:CR=1 FL=1
MEQTAKDLRVKLIEGIPIGKDVDAQQTRLAAIDFLKMMRDDAPLPIVSPLPQGDIQGLKMNFEMSNGYRVVVFFEAGQKGTK